jgi:glycerophosphoryl diester phosphodiesterase
MVSRRVMMAAGVSLALASALLVSGSALAETTKPRPLIMAHRGASALRPEHTLAAYAKAIEDGADFIEPDLVATKDGVLVARHENDISGTTDVASHPEFASRRVTKTVDGVQVTGWFTEDFTLADLKTLRARERLGAGRPESQRYDGTFHIVTLDEVADFVAAEASAQGRTIGLIPELKHSTYFAGLGLPLEPRLIAALKASPYLRRAPVIVQSFEVANLKALRAQVKAFGNVRLMQLLGAPDEAPYDSVAAGKRLTYGQMLTPSGLAQIRRYADWLSPPTRMIVPVGADGRLTASTGLVAAAHAQGLLVGTWTFRPENRFLAADFRDASGEDVRNEGGSIAEIRRYLTEGLDGFFTDDPGLGRKALSTPEVH